MVQGFRDSGWGKVSERMGWLEFEGFQDLHLRLGKLGWA